MKLHYSSMWKCFWFKSGRWLVRFELAPKRFGFQKWRDDWRYFWKFGNIIISRDKEEV